MEQALGLLSTAFLGVIWELKVEQPELELAPIWAVGAVKSRLTRKVVCKHTYLVEKVRNEDLIGFRF